MNLRNIRDSIICNNSAKVKIYKEKIRTCILEYFDSSDITCVETLITHLEIIGIMLTSDDKTIKNEIAAMKPQIYSKIKKIITNFCDENFCTEKFDDFLARLENNKNNACDETTSDVMSEESECVFSWKNNKNTKQIEDQNGCSQDDATTNSTSTQQPHRSHNRFTPIYPSTSLVRYHAQNRALQDRASQDNRIYFTEVHDNVEIVRRETTSHQNSNERRNVTQSNGDDYVPNDSNQMVITDTFIETLNEAFGETLRSESDTTTEHRSFVGNETAVQVNETRAALQNNNNTQNTNLISATLQNSTQDDANQNTNDTMQLFEVTFRDETGDTEIQNDADNIRNVNLYAGRSVGRTTAIPNLVAPDEEPRATRDDQTNMILSRLRENGGQIVQQVTQSDIDEIFNPNINDNDSTEAQMDMNELPAEYVYEANVIPSEPTEQSYATTEQYNNYNKLTFEQSYSTETESITKYSIRNKTEDNKKTEFSHTLIKLFQSIKFISKSPYMHDKEIIFFMIWLLKEDFFDKLCYYYKNRIIDLLTESLFNLTKTPSSHTNLRAYDILKNMPINQVTAGIYRLFLDKNSAKYKSLNDFTKVHDSCANTKDKIKVLDCLVKWIHYYENKKNENLNNVVLQKLTENLFIFQDQTLVLIGKLVYKNINLQKYCLKTEIASQIIAIFEELYWKKNKSITVIFCLSSLIDRCEENRKMFYSRKVFHKMFDHFKSLIKDESFGYEFAVCLYFLRNMTRSIKFIRADLPEFPIVELLLFCLKKIIKTRNTKNVDILDLIDIKDESIVTEKKKCANLLIKQILAILSNLILEYGNYKEKFTKKGGLRLIKKVSSKKNLEYNVLFTLKNYLYECTIGHKDYFLNVFAPKIIDSGVVNTEFCVTKKQTKDFSTKKLEECIKNNIYYYQSKTQTHYFIKVLKKYKKINLETRTIASMKACKTLKELFNLIRNILCCNMQENMYFTSTYDDLIENVILMMYKLNKGAMYDEKNETLKQVIYIFVNLTASKTKFKNVFMNDMILCELKVLSNNTNKKIIVALIWLVINLTWCDDDNYKVRVRKLTEFGFKKWLNDIKGTNAFINDKVITALENMDTR